MVNNINGNVLEIPRIYICHQVNCKGVMGAGLAKQIKDNWPFVYSVYKNQCLLNENSNLGTIQIIPIHDTVSIVNMFAQENYGIHQRQTDYEAFTSCLKELKKEVKLKDIIRFPYKIGCGLAGGNWQVVLNIITKELKDYRVEIYHLN